MKKTYLMPVAFLLLPVLTFCQSGEGSDFSLIIVDEHRQPVNGATVRVLKNGKVVNSMVAGENGHAVFVPLNKGVYKFLISSTGYGTVATDAYSLPGHGSDTIRLLLLNGSLQEVTVSGHTPPIERKRDKTIVNVEASVTNTGSSVLEVLERSPGVTVDRNGGITLNGKQGVLVMIDDRQTYLSGEDLNNLLSSMSASQVAQIELIANPTAKYDAAGGGGVINIKTKKNKSDGLNGVFTTSYGQGVYPKSNNTLVLNYRKGRMNAFFNYSFSDVKYLMDLYAYREYYNDNKEMTAMLRQPTYFKGTLVNNTLKTGVDYSFSSATTVGLVLTGTEIRRKSENTAHADWLQPNGTIDSSIQTSNRPRNRFRNGALNLNARHHLSRYADVTADVDYLHYAIALKHDFNNRLLGPAGYEEVFRSRIATAIHIFSGKVDALIKVSPDVTMQAGLKSSSSHTDNSAVYDNLENQQWVNDETRNNHFIYREKIQAVYGSVEGKYDRLSYQAGLRYEYTSYTARQLGNSLQKDSTVARNYGSFFPSGYLSYKLDSLNSLTFTIGRRTDRPVFQNLNPFLYIINKYSYQTGNPYLLPQYTWNFELRHQYGNLLTTGVSYSRTSDYFSQIFLSDSSKTILYYTQGNVGLVYNLGVSSSLSLSLLKPWSMELTAVFNHKQLRGFSGNSLTATINQLHVNVNNQLDLGKGYTAEVSGFYTTRCRQDIQELIYPAGQVAVGIGKSVLKKKGSVKLSYRDIFYTGAMEGLTSFPDATEYFKIKRDSRVLTLTFSLRFGSVYKVSRHQEGASEEKQRVQNL
jgi:iron complex outermembrane receptor protein